MIRTSLLVLLSLIGAFLVGCGSNEKPKAQTGRSAARPVRKGLWITDPPDSARVPYRPYVLGTISDTSISALFLVVHPTPTKEYWIQPPCMLRPDGAWLGQPYIGLENTPAGVSFEIRAVADPVDDIKPGTSLKDWPPARYSSNVVTVFRQ
ncbi:MAG: hypothetical protein ABIK37_07455 [candidate division WOR-3 bacterium]